MLYTVLTSVLGLSLIVVVVAFLRSRGTFHEESAGFVTNLLLLLVLPANIVYELTFVKPQLAHLKMIAIMIVVSLVNLTLAYLCGRLLRLRRAEIGALMVTAGFSATAFIGLPVLKILYPDDLSMHADAIVVSELGMVVPILVLGPIIAQIFGEQEQKEKTSKLTAGSVKKYLMSPVAWALVVGLLAAFTEIHVSGFFWESLTRALLAASSGLMFLPLVLIGLILKPAYVKHGALAILAAVLIQLVVEPYLTSTMSQWLALTPKEREVLVILTMTPAALVSPAFAAKYRCAPELAAAITFASMVAVVVLFPLMYFVLG